MSSASMSPYAETVDPLPPPSRFLWIAHRGYSVKYPENTLPAFEGAIEAGADMIELDIRISRDGHIVTIHDETIDRTSDGRGRIADLSLADLKRYNYRNGHKDLDFVAIPTLEEVLDRVGNRVLLNIEIKKDPGEREGMEQTLVELLRRKHMTNRVIVSSFNRGALHTVKRIYDSVKTGLVFEGTPLDFREAVTSLSLYSVHPSLKGMDPALLQWAKSRGLLVYAWVAKDRKTVRKCCLHSFIDGVMVNDLELLSPFMTDSRNGGVKLGVDEPFFLG